MGDDPQPPDELDEVGQQIADLVARADDLRDRSIAPWPGGPIRGAAFDVTVRHGTGRRFDRSLLHVRDDPRDWHAVKTQTVTARPLDDAPRRPDDDIDLIGPF